jgi:tRNA pseudouridine55 synthase
LADGVVVIDKPSGMTSHDVVARVRRILGTREVGHAGTLDPMATGALVVVVGEATKLVSYLTADDKEYACTVELGVATDTLDAGGRETERVAVPAGWEARLEEALAEERQRDFQEPPAFSAIHVDGERAHEQARRGESPRLAARPVRVVSLVATTARTTQVDLRLVVSKGYYVRALARDLAARLGTVGHLTALRRLRSGSFTLAEGTPLAALVATAPLIPVAEAAARVLPMATLTDIGVAHARAGRRVPLIEIAPPHERTSAWLAPTGALVAIGCIEDGTGRVIRGFRCD